MIKKLILLGGIGVGVLASSKSAREQVLRKVKDVQGGSSHTGREPSAGGQGGTPSTAPGASLSGSSGNYGDSTPMGSTASDSKGPTRP